MTITKIKDCTGASSVKNDKTDITVPKLSNKEYINLIKEHYLKLASKVTIRPDGTAEVPANECPELVDYIKANRAYRELQNFASDIRIWTYYADKLPLTKNDIETKFQNYETEIMPETADYQKYYNYNRNVITLKIISENWNEKQRRKFNESYLDEFRRFIHKGVDKDLNDLYDYGDFQPRGYEVTDNPKGHLTFLISKDGLQQPVTTICELEPKNPAKFKEVGYYGYDEPNDIYNLKSFAVKGPLNVFLDNLLTKQDKRDIFDYMQKAIIRLGVIHIEQLDKNQIDKLYPGTTETISWATNPNSPSNIFEQLAKYGDHYDRIDVARNPYCPPYVLEQLANDKTWIVRDNVAQNPNCSAHALEQLSKDEDLEVRNKVAKNPNCPEHILNILSQDNNHDVRRAVASNKNCPLKTLERLMKDPDESTRDIARVNLDSIKSEYKKQTTKQNNKNNGPHL